MQEKEESDGHDGNNVKNPGKEPSARQNGSESNRKTNAIVNESRRMRPIRIVL